MIKLSIAEEYGYRLWVAYLDKVEYMELVDRWRSMEGLHAMVPVLLIVPQAVPAIEFEDINVHVLAEQGAKRCHIHECDDSYLQGAHYGNYYYDIPEAPEFEIGGKVYTREDLGNLPLLGDVVHNS